MKDKTKSSRRHGLIVLVVVFLLGVILSLSYLLMRQSSSAMIALMQTRMLDIANTSAAMLDGDVLQSITAEDKGTPGYEAIMKTLTYFQDNMALKYIYCIRDEGDGRFTFSLDPDVETPGEFGAPVVYTDALYKASQGTPAADEVPYQDAWGTFYSAYSPVFNSSGEVAGIVAVDFSAEWYNQQLATLRRTTVIVALLSLLLGGGIAVVITMKRKRQIGSIHGRLNEMAATLMQEMGTASQAEGSKLAGQDEAKDAQSMDALERQIQSMQVELRTQIAQVHGQAYRDDLTGVKSKHAFTEMEKELDEKLSGGVLPAFAVVVCDVNGLKKINDTLGHKAGDEYIRSACRMICDVFAHSPVYRIGGDEFAVILTGRDYENRRALMRELHRQSSEHIATQEAIVSGGLAEYQPDQDHCVHEIFERADATMYKEKMLLKSLGAAVREDESEKPVADADAESVPDIRVRKHILIADDVPTNRELLGDLLQDDYDIFYAADGRETLETLRAHKDEIALLLLDLYMPNMTGREVMTAMQVDEELMSIPVIVLTVDEDAELDCLKIGAMDFIPKPYPDIEIIKARIAKCIELSENRDLIRHTQRDRLTGLYNFDYFLRYAQRFDQHYRDAALDAVVCDVNQFHLVNERYGSNYGDLVLRSIGISMKKLARKTGGISCRRGLDTFLLYCPHQEDYDQLLRKLMSELFIEKETASRVSLRFGVYANVNRQLDIEDRFARAKSAADSVKNDADRLYGLYEEIDP